MRLESQLGKGLPLEEPASSQPSPGASLWRAVLGIAILLLVICVSVGGYYLSKFMILFTSDILDAEWINTRSVIAWLLSVVVVLLLFGALRLFTSYIARLFRFIFKFAQSDIVTIVLASGVNLLFMIFGGWLTHKVITVMTLSSVNTFFSFDNPLSVFIMFYMIGGALIWIPRLGAYGENQIGAVIDNDRW